MRRNADSALAAAAKVLFIPDALSYMLTGPAVCEYSVLSSAQLLNPRTGEIDADLLRPLGLDRSQFGPMVRPGTRVGTLTDDVQKATGLGPVPSLP
jgi:rhamnulokinase